jgi:hypothetical protein
VNTHAYKQLHRVREHTVQRFQMALEEGRRDRDACAQKLRQLSQALETHTPPESGTFAELSAHHLTARIYRRQIGEALEALQQQRQRVAQIKRDLKAAMIESEKIAHLDREEQLKTLKTLKRREAFMLDEAGMMSHAWQDGGKR